MRLMVFESCMVILLDGAPFTDNTDETKNNASVGKDIALYKNSVIQVKGNLGINVYDVAKYADGSHQPGLITAGLSNNGTVNNFKSSEGYLLNSNKNAVLGFKVTLNTNGGIINSGNVTGYIVGTETVLPTDVTKKDRCSLDGLITANSRESRLREYLILKQATDNIGLNGKRDSIPSYLGMMMGRC